MSEEIQKSEEISKGKSAYAEREEKILAFWKERDIFRKTLEKFKPGKAPEGEFVFFEGPPTANGHPGIHHLEARVFKDAIPRYKTMRGFYVRRKGGWDTHGLPVELQVEKSLGLKSKKEIESYGIVPFNEKCKESVWTYVREWEDFTNRMGYWVDLKNPYITYRPAYIEALWGIMGKVSRDGLLYKDYKVVPWCPRCGTALSSHELAQGYETVKDLAVTVKFKIKPGQKIDDMVVDDQTYLLAWTTTPWTLPGNVGLAVGEKIQYQMLKLDDGTSVVFAWNRFHFIKKLSPYKDRIDYSKEPMFPKGSSLVGLEYEPLYPFLKDNISGPEKEKLTNAYKVYPADFVTTEDGTGIVHTAVMYGQDDFELGTKVGLPKYHLVNEDGTFKKETGFLAGLFVKDPETEVIIIKDLAGRKGGSLLFDKEKYEHTYPSCWRCKTRLIYFARDSWYIKMSAHRDKLVKENEGINWEPAHIKEGRFGEWLREIKDWAISRERYWGTPLPVWVCDDCKAIKVVGSVAEIVAQPKNTYHIMRHGQSENNVSGTLNSHSDKVFHLTELGREEARDSAKHFKGKFDLIYCSPLTRTRETAGIVAEVTGYDPEKIIVDDRLIEIDFGELDGGSGLVYGTLFQNREDYFTKVEKGVENRNAIKRRVGAFLEEIERSHSGKSVLIVSHDGPLWMLEGVARGLDIEGTLALKGQGEEYLNNAEIRKLDYQVLPHNLDHELDLHRPYIDGVKLACQCGGEMARVKEVMDVWFDSGAMPFAQDHRIGDEVDRPGGAKAVYPADFISEAIDQTRGWFYTLHAVGTLMGKGKAYKNVICLGHILDAHGKKMSKSIGNIINPWEMMDLYGADALRLWMYSVNQPGDSKNFDPKTVDEINKKVFNLAGNVLSFYQTYVGDSFSPDSDRKVGISKHVLDRWIVARLDQLTIVATEGLDAYRFFEPVRAIKDFIADLSQWYLRRSRDRFKGDDLNDKQAALVTTRKVLLNLSKIMAPFTPFFAEHLYRELKGEKESVHLEAWPKAGKVDEKLLEMMDEARHLASKGLEARMSAKINVRQPLTALKVKDAKLKNLDQPVVSIVKDEVNVKDVRFDPSLAGEVELDLVITPDLKEEGEIRELLRRIQDLRKDKGLTVNDLAILVATPDLRDLISGNESVIKASTKLSAIEFGQTFDIRK